MQADIIATPFSNIMIPKHLLRVLFKEFVITCAFNDAFWTQSKDQNGCESRS